jgi:hypothetical protein
MSNAATRVHHPYSPSTLQAREACPCWTPSGGTNEAAEAGTLQHDAAEKGLDDPRLSDAQAAAVAQCKAFCDDLASKFPGATVLNEQYLPVDDEVIWANDPPPLRSRSKFLGTTAGFMDWGLVTADGLHGELVDYKMGQHAVEEASNNLQGVSYALGLFKKYPTLRDVTVTFLLPYRDEVDQHTFDMTNALALLLRIKTVVHRAIEAKRAGDFLTARPSVSACSFCGALGTCPKVAELALHVGRKYRPIDVPKNLTPSMMLDPKDVGLGLQLAMVLKAWAEAYRAQATQKTIMDDKFVPEGYRLVSSVKRSVRKARELVETAKEFLPEDQWPLLEALFEVPLGPVEKLISVAAPRGSKEDTVEEFGRIILEAGLVEE